MAKIHIGNLVEIRHWIVPDDDERDEGYWIVVNQFQNANRETKLKHEQCDWPFLSFIYSGATRTRTGDNIEAGLSCLNKPGVDGLCLRHRHPRLHRKATPHQAPSPSSDLPTQRRLHRRCPCHQHRALVRGINGLQRGDSGDSAIQRNRRSLCWVSPTLT